MKRKLTLTNLDKLYWPDEKITKGDLIHYYRSVAPLILPYLRNRPLSLKRNPDGIRDPGFYHKDAGDIAPPWMKIAEIPSGSGDKIIRYLVCQDQSSLLFIANLGCIEMNPWNSAVAALDRPDYLVIDIDPSEKNSFEQVIEIARCLKEALDELGLAGCCKTSGASGLHVYLPCARRYEYAQVRDFAHMLALLVQQRLPGFTTLERSLSKRRNNQVYIDYLQNSRGQTLACAYSARPRPGAPVSAPLEWKEVRPGLHPLQFTMHNILRRIGRKGDLFRPVLGKGIDMPRAIARMEKVS